jgi:peroxiredoxin
VFNIFRMIWGGLGMSKIQPGAAAPQFSLAGLDGRPQSLAEALKKGPVLAAFFKVSCPVCQFTFPFLERMYETYGDTKVTFWGVSQDDAHHTRDFNDQFGVKFPVLIDADGYKATRQFGLTNVPSVFLIASDGKVRATSIGFSKKDLETMAAEIAQASGKPPQPLFRPGESVPAFRPG